MISEDLKYRIDRKQEKPFGKVEMGRHFVHYLVRERLKTVINALIKDEILSEMDRITDYDIREEVTDGIISYIGDKYYDELVKAFVPFFELCSMCKSDKKCSIQERIINANLVVYTGLQQAFPDIDISPTFTICKCGMYEIVDASRLLTGYNGRREDVLKNGKV